MTAGIALPEENIEPICYNYDGDDHYDGDDPVNYVLSLNMKRRHLTLAQKKETRFDGCTTCTKTMILAPALAAPPNVIGAPVSDLIDLVSVFGGTALDASTAAVVAR